MKISVTRSEMVIEIDRRSIKISGELTLTPAFYADLASMRSWEPPHENEPFTEEDKTKIISKVDEGHNSKEGVVKIFFD